MSKPPKPGASLGCLLCCGVKLYFTIFRACLCQARSLVWQGSRFSSLKSCSSIKFGVWGERGEGEGGKLVYLSTSEQMALNRGLLHPQPRGTGLGSGPRIQTMGTNGSSSDLTCLGQKTSPRAGKLFLQAQKRDLGEGGRGVTPWCNPWQLSFKN